MACVVGIPCPDCATAFLDSPSHQQNPKLQKLQRAIRHQAGEPQCASFVFHVQHILPKKLNANRILNCIHACVNLQYKSVVCIVLSVLRKMRHQIDVDPCRHCGLQTCCMVHAIQLQHLKTFKGTGWGTLHDILYKKTAACNWKPWKQESALCIPHPPWMPQSDVPPHGMGKCRRRVLRQARALNQATDTLRQRFSA